ncbi:uncharacterized protein L3040_007757 [Drepanopeziza brunnea f. sp. 'multigermtubi']|uniref:ABC transporter n=1 Tax=Marssonina brunnea f. sp. multigermtubi (strain MB_m1) TaxID=1072389 RepID=K1XZ08_MARBU|nr:ABC transporter [Drepanopeziza brunnea f. sp. 'multigermtubi' MB_m1]EKD18064.1 ABC transporter [Drepanopeziza brunnea f. sp. 'multigermtubi' MB_m1]KAJ5037586.1 hypothetical protein L3040_007757 [Drepanopeziza brunnea f. sp. 'multigermtubi']
MAFFKQTWTLTRKNLLIAFNRSPRSSIFRAFLLPVFLIAFLSFARNLFVSPSSYGIGTANPIRTLAEGINAAGGGRNTLALVNNGLVGGDVARVIDALAVAATAAGATVARLTTDTELLETCRSSLRGATSCYGAVVFISSPTEGPGGRWNYTLRADGALGDEFYYDRTTNDAQIYLLPLQRAVDTAIAGLADTTTAQAALPATGLEYPYTSLTEDQRETKIRVDFQASIINALAVAFLIGMVGITYHLTGFIASERELGMSQLIEAMMPNLRRWQPQAARFVSYHLAFDIIYLPGWIILSIILSIGLFAETSVIILVIYHILAGLSLASFSILGASFFKKAQLSGFSVTLATLMLGVLGQVFKPTSSVPVAILGLLFAPCNYVFFLVFMARFERQEMATDLLSAAPRNPWSLPGIVLWVFLIIQIFAYPILGAMVERALYGTTSKGRTVTGQNLETEADDSSSETVQLQGFTKHYQPSWLSRKFAGITKNPTATVVAVNDLTLSARKGQICVLLGANGSGKSTTLDAIAGLNQVTSGTIKVDGTGGIGYAPQKNVLWDDLTVEEHIRIFNRLKSAGKHDSKDSLRSLISAIDLDKKINSRSKTLSGGQKRKLQLGMMFTGGSAVCCVDEVSSGLDPLSRRKIWDILLAERGSRSIILTTHFLDEADLLADQIAILSKGTLRAQGSSVELKNQYGGGYRIYLPAGSGHEQVPAMEGVASREVFGQMVYSAPTSSQAAQIIRRLESGGVTDYQLSGPTIEDVFLLLAEEARAESTGLLEKETDSESEKKIGTTTKATAEPSRKLELHTGKTIGLSQQVWVLFRKRYTILRRNYLPYVAALLLSVIAAALVTLLLDDFEAVGCSPEAGVTISDVESLAGQSRYSLVVGPSSRFTNATLTSLYAPLVPSQQQIQLVDSLAEFNAYIGQNFANVTPGGFFIDGSQTTLAYKGNGDFYTSIFAQNLMDVALSNTTIGIQYAPFDLPLADNTGKALQLVIYFGLAMAAYPAFFSLYPTIERTMHIRGLQYSNGVRPLPLWLAYLAFDFLFVLLSSALTVIIFAAASSAWYYVGYLFVVFMLFGLVSTLLSYVVSLFAKSQLSAFAFVAAGQALMFLIYFIAYLATLTYAPLHKVDDYLRVVHFAIAVITPMGSLIRSLFLALNIFSTTCSGRNLASYPGGILQYGGPILYLVLQAFALFACLMWHDSGSVMAWYRRLRKSTVKPDREDLPTDEEPAEELDRVSGSEDGLRVQHLTKSFGPLTAVDNLSFGIKRSEVFALLGPNGAGKSTTISLIRGDIRPSKNGGNIFVENVEINQNRAEARSHLGVCPQHDAIDQMTVVEHLRFYARVRGVPDVEHNVREVIRAVGLDAFTSRMAADLSGGNKRKLSLGIALIGNPTVLLLDEPSSGMDAASKRIMWKTLAAIVPGRSLLLTTHSMEEADALANRAGIMAKRMLAMGSSDYLRHKHADAHYIHLVLKSAPHTSPEEVSSVRSWILHEFPGADIEEHTYHGQIRFSVPVQRPDAGNVDVDEIQGEVGPNGVGALIMTLEDQREKLGLEHYSVSPTTLDEVFLTIVQKHKVEEEGYSAGEKTKKPKWNLFSRWMKK